MVNFLLYLFSFVVIWFGSGLIINSIDRIAKKLKISSFAISFFILGILTSIPEIAIATTALIDKNPEIFVGNLLGGIIVLFLFVIPILAIFGKEIKLSHELGNENIILSLLVIITPFLFILDKKISNSESLFLIIIYFVLLFFIQRKNGFFDNNQDSILTSKSYTFFDLIKVSFGIGIVFLASQYIVDQTLYFSKILKVPTFYISLFFLSLGTNFPELSLAIRSIHSGKKDIAFGDYLGSAATNVLLIGFFSLINDGEVITVNDFFTMFLFIFVGLILFFYFLQSKRNISRKEGFCLISIYFIFVIYEFVTKFL